MEISLSKELEQTLNSVMVSGKFKSPEECIMEGLKALKLQRLNEELQIGLDQLERGEGIPYDRENINKEIEKQLKNL